MKVATTVTVMLAAIFALTPARSSSGLGLVADLSSNHVAISTGFTGTDVLLFGAIDGGGDIVVVITGPSESVVVRQKRRVAGIWVNSESVTFENVPNFYAIATSRPLAGVTTPDVRKTQQIGVENLSFAPAGAFKSWPDEDLAPFRDALIRGKQRDGLYSDEPARVTVVSDRLFRTSIQFPANMATGSYTAVVYQLDDIGTVHAVSTPIRVEKVGLGADVFEIAHRQSAWYGVGAILVAVAAGWLSGVVFRKI